MFNFDATRAINCRGINSEGATAWVGKINYLAATCLLSRFPSIAWSLLHGVIIAIGYPPALNSTLVELIKDLSHDGVDLDPITTSIRNNVPSSLVTRRSCCTTIYLFLAARTYRMEILRYWSAKDRRLRNDGCSLELGRSKGREDQPCSESPPSRQQHHREPPDQSWWTRWKCDKLYFSDRKR